MVYFMASDRRIPNKEEITKQNLRQRSQTKLISTFATTRSWPSCPTDIRQADGVDSFFFSLNKA